MAKNKFQSAEATEKEQIRNIEDDLQNIKESLETIEERVTKTGNINFNDSSAKLENGVVDDKEIVENLKTENEKLKETINSLNEKINKLEEDLSKNIGDFQEKAKLFATKAQEKIDEQTNELHEKLNLEREHIKKYGSQKLLESIIDHLLNIELAIENGKNHDAVSAYVVGFEMIINQIYDELSSFGVARIEPKIGDEFDANIHFAISIEEGSKPNTILSIKKPGIKLHDRVLKPATVVVSKDSTASNK